MDAQPISSSANDPSTPLSTAPIVAEGKSNPARMEPLLLIVGLVVVLGVAYTVFFSGGVSLPPLNTAGNPSGTSDELVPTTLDNPQKNLQALKSTLSKEKFLQKLYETNRDEYDLYEKAAEYMGVSMEEITQFFFDCCDLTNEADIFSELPPVPNDFSKVAYDVSVGKLYQIGLLAEEYYKQPEFYTFVDQETGVVNREYAFRPWKKLQLNQWGDNGLQVYPSKQWTTVSPSNPTFRGVIFVTNAWNIQNHVGIQLVANKSTYDSFDLTISEDSTGKPYFLLGPTFPRFHSAWATKVVVEGTLKPGIAPGEYIISIDPVPPPTELNDKWSSDHPGLYAPYGWLRPSDSYINLHITVTE